VRDRSAARRCHRDDTGAERGSTRPDVARRTCRVRLVVIALVCVAGTATADPPRSDEASGIAVAPEEDSRPIANALLFVPGEVVVLVLSAPRYAAAGVDAYLAARSPNTFGRDTHAKWRAGGEFSWETVLGPSIAARVGYEVAPGVAIDAYGGAFGPRGESGG